MVTRDSRMLGNRCLRGREGWALKKEILDEALRLRN